MSSIPCFGSKNLQRMFQFLIVKIKTGDDRTQTGRSRVSIPLSWAFCKIRFFG